MNTSFFGRLGWSKVTLFPTQKQEVNKMEMLGIVTYIGILVIVSICRIVPTRKSGYFAQKARTIKMNRRQA